MVADRHAGCETEGVGLRWEAVCIPAHPPWCDMKRILALTAAGLLLLSPVLLADDKPKPKDDQAKTGDGKDTFDLIVKDMVKTLKSVTTLLTGVTDQKSADKAK